ncbi:MAG: hypothetical protein HY559_03605 [Gammaproteobacteria bacterium]|nr:hypothetical protein [Gammaproteobacteria bacterium]
MINFHTNGFKTVTACFGLFFSSLLLAAPPSPADIVSHIEAPRTQAHTLHALRQAIPSILSQSGISPLDLEKYHFVTGLEPKTLTSYSHLTQEQLLELLSVVSRHMTYRSLSAYADVLMDVVNHRKEGNIYNFEQAIAQRTHLPLSTVEQILDIEVQLPKISRRLRAQVLVKLLRYFSPSDGLYVPQILASTEWTAQEKGDLKELLGLPGTFSLPPVSFKNPAVVLLKDVYWPSLLKASLPIPSGKLSFNAYLKQASQLEKEWKNQLKQEGRYNKEEMVAEIASRLLQELKLASLFLAPMEEGNRDPQHSKYLKFWKARLERLYTTYHLPVSPYEANQHIQKAEALARFMANAFQRVSFQSPHSSLFEINLKNESVHFNGLSEEEMDRNFALVSSESPCSPEQKKTIRERKEAVEGDYQSSLKTLQKFYSSAFVDERVQETEKQAHVLLSEVTKTLDALGDTVLTFLNDSSIAEGEKDKVKGFVSDRLLSALKNKIYKGLSYETAATCVLEPIIPVISLITESHAQSLELAITNRTLFSQGMARSQDFDRYASPPQEGPRPYETYLNFFTRKPGEAAKDYLLRVQGSEEAKVMGEITEGYQHLLNLELLMPTLLVTGPTLQIGSKALLWGASLQGAKVLGVEGALARLGTLLVHPFTQAVVPAWVTSDMAISVWGNILKVPEWGKRFSETLIQELQIVDPSIQSLVHGGVGTGVLLIPSLILAKRLPSNLNRIQKTILVGGAPTTVATCSLLETLALLSEDRHLAQTLSMGETMNLFSQIYEESSLRTLGYLAYNHLGAVVYPSPLLNILGIPFTGFAGGAEAKDFIYGMGNAWERYQETGNRTALALRVAANIIDITDVGSTLATPHNQLKVFLEEAQLKKVLLPRVKLKDLKAFETLSPKQLLSAFSPEKAQAIEQQVEASLARSKEIHGAHPGINYSAEIPPFLKEKIFPMMQEMAFTYGIRRPVTLVYSIEGETLTVISDGNQHEINIPLFWAQRASQPFFKALLAHEMSHVALSEKLGSLFAITLFPKRYSSRNDLMPSMQSLGIAKGLEDLWVNEYRDKFFPEFAKIEHDAFVEDIKKFSKSRMAIPSKLNLSFVLSWAEADRHGFDSPSTSIVMSWMTSREQAIFKSLRIYLRELPKLNTEDPDTARQQMEKFVQELCKILGYSFIPRLTQEDGKNVWLVE